MAILKHLPELVQRIGIDRTVLFEFLVRSVNEDVLCRTVADFGINETDRYVSVTYDDKSPIVLEDGKHLAKLEVRDHRFGRISVSFTRNNLNGRQYTDAKLELMVSDTGNNVQNLTSDEYKLRVADVFQLLKIEYGIDVDFSEIRVKKMELNATFYLDEAYEKYQRAILLLIRNVPAKRYGGHSCNNAVKYATWHEATQNFDRLETVLVKNSSVELKIYNKGKHLKDLGLIDSTAKDIMRVEYTIKDHRILDTFFGDNLVASLDDEKIKGLFKKYFNRDVVAQYYNWAARNHEILTELVKKHRAEHNKWTGYFFREVRQLEAVQGLPALFDLNDLYKVFRQLEPKSGRNARKKFNKLKKQAVYEQDLIGHTDRVREIIMKVMDM